MNKYNRIKVSIIILNWNGEKLLQECLDSVYKNNLQNTEIILVDNASTDNSIGLVKQNFPEIKIIRNKKNYGYAKGNNIGIKNARGKYIVILNNDVIVEEDWLEKLVNAADTNDSTGIFGSKQMFYHNKNEIDSLGGFLKKDGPHNINNSTPWTNPDKNREVFSVAGAAMLLKRKMLQEVGLFDPMYFLYYEDFDLCWRARLLGWKCYYVSSAVIYHHRGASTSRTGKHMYYGTRNEFWTLLKNFSYKNYVKHFPYLIIKNIRRFINATTGNKAWILLGLLNGIINIQSIINKHKKIQSVRKIDESAIEKWIRN